VITIYYLLVFSYHRTAVFKIVTSSFPKAWNIVEFFNYERWNSLEHPNFIPIYIQQGAKLHSLFYLETALHVSVGTSTHYQECIQLYLQLLAATAAGSK
jgi:hypothetical protein